MVIFCLNNLTVLVVNCIVLIWLKIKVSTTMEGFKIQKHGTIFWGEFGILNPSLVEFEGLRLPPPS